MKSQSKKEKVGTGTAPKFNTGLDFCVQMNTTPGTGEDCSRKEVSEENEEQVQRVIERFIEVNFLKTYYECEDRLIRRQIITSGEVKMARKNLGNEEEIGTEEEVEIGDVPTGYYQGKTEDYDIRIVEQYDRPYLIKVVQYEHTRFTDLEKRYKELDTENVELKEQLSKK